MCHCVVPCFYLSRWFPSGFKCFQSISTETNAITSKRYSFFSSSMLFTKDGSFWVLVDGCLSIPSLLQNWTWEFLLIQLLLRQKSPIKEKIKKQWLDRQKLTFKANKRHFKLGKSHSCNVSLEVQEKCILFRSESDWFCPPSSGISFVNRHVRLYFRYCLAEEMRALTFNQAYSLTKLSS